MLQLIYWLVISADFRLRFFSALLDVADSNFFSDSGTWYRIYNWRYKCGELQWSRYTKISDTMYRFEFVSEKRRCKDITQAIILPRDSKKLVFENTLAQLRAVCPESISEEFPDLIMTIPGHVLFTFRKTELVIESFFAVNNTAEQYLCDCIKRIAYSKGVRVIRGKLEREYAATFTNKGFILQNSNKGKNKKFVRLCYPVSKRGYLRMECYVYFTQILETKITRWFYRYQYRNKIEPVKSLIDKGQ